MESRTIVTDWQLKNTRQALRLLIDSSPYHSLYNASEPSPDSSASSSTLSSRTTTSTATTPSTGTSGSISANFHCQWQVQVPRVLCLYNFDSVDPDHLPFHAGEILLVVKKEESGWWAAMRPSEDRVGWIPSAFVEPLAQEQRMGKRVLPNTGDRPRFVDAEVDTICEVGIASSRFDHDGSLPLESHDEAWVPVVEDVKATPLQLHLTLTDLVPGGVVSHSAGSGHNLDSFFIDADEGPKIIQVPSSTSTPQLHKPLTFASETSLEDAKQSSNEQTRKHGRTFSQSISGRHNRRHRLCISDRASLSRLSTLIESEEPNLLSNPGLNHHFDAFAQAALKQTEKNKESQRDNISIHESRESPQPQTPWYLRPTYSAELEIESDDNVKAGTLPALMEKLTTEPIRSPDLEFRKIFLLTFGSFVTSERLFELLVERFEMRGPINLSPVELEEWKEKKLLPAQSTVLTIMMMWLEDYNMLDEEPEISRRLLNFLSAIVTPSQLSLTAKSILQAMGRMIFAQPASNCLHFSPRRYNRAKSYKSDLLRWNPSELAEQLSLVEHKNYTNIRPRECLYWAKTQVGSEVENITIFYHTHHQLAAWVKVSILTCDILRKRANIVDFWIRVAEKCRNIHNFHSMSAVVAGLSSTAIARLQFTWFHCSQRSQFDTLVKFCDPLNTFSGYKHLFQSTAGPCVPYVQMFLADIAQIQRQYPDHVPSSTALGDVPLIFFTKRQRWHQVISTMLRYQSKPYPFACNHSARHLIEGSLRTSGSAGQDWFRSKSQELQQGELAHRKDLEVSGLTF